MKQPEIPLFEGSRLAELASLNLLDTPAEERFDRITRIARRAFGTSMALISLVDAGRQWFKSCQGLGVSETERAVSFCGHAILSDDPLVVPDARTEERFHDNPLVVGHPNIRFYAGQPIHGPTGHRVGTLCILDQEPRDLGPDDRVILKDLAALVESELRLGQLSLSEMRLRETLSVAERKASTDPLTRLWNRESIFRLLDFEVERLGPSGGTIAVAMVDIDHFKVINDTYGHLVGDEVLTGVAARLRASLREGDLAGRFGGEEFVVLFSSADEVHLSSAAERLRESVSHSPIACSQMQLPVTVSVGLYTGRVNSATSRNQLLAAADTALYAAKRYGRNRVEVQAELGSGKSVCGRD